MTSDEADAITTYLEFHLIKFVEGIEKHTYDPDIVGDMYERAYTILADFERTLDMQTIMDEQAKLGSRK